MFANHSYQRLVAMRISGVRVLSDEGRKVK